MQRLFNALFYNLEQHEMIEVRLRPPGSPSAQPYLFDNIDGAISRAEKSSGKFDVWFGVAPRFKSSNVVKRLGAVWVDIDAKDLNANMDVAYATAVNSIALRPSCVVMSGFGYHAYWFLSESTNPTFGRKLLEALQKAHSSDHTIDVTRFLRVPGTLNMKYEPPRPCEIEYLDEVRYKAEDLLAAATLPQLVTERIITGDSTGFKSRSERDWNVITALVQSGMTDEGVEQVFDSRHVGDKYADHPNSQHYLKTTLANAAESIAKAAVSIAGTDEAPFITRDDCYFTQKGKGGLVQVSTFTLHPTKLVTGAPDGDVLVCQVRSAGEQWEEVEFPRRAFDRSYNLQKQLTSAYWQWLGTDAQVRQLLPFLLNVLEASGGPVVSTVTAMGRHDDMWVTDSGLITTNGHVPSDSAPFHYLGQGREFYTTWYSERGHDFDDIVEAFARLYPELNVPDVVYPFLGWFVAAMIKPLFESCDIPFPNLSVWGTKGSGKSTMIDFMYKLTGVKNPRAVNCRTTPFVLLSLLAATTSIPVHLGEFRGDMPESQYRAIRTWLLMAYDSGRDARGRPDQSVVEYPLTAPIALDGEDLFDDPAVRERMIAIGMSPETIAEGTEAWRSYMELTEYSVDQLALPLVKYTLGINESWVGQTFATMLERMHKAFPIQLPARVRKNVAVCLVGWQVFTDFMRTLGQDFPVPYPDAFSEALSEVVNLLTGRTMTQVDEMVVDLVNHAARGGHGFNWKYESNLNILWVHLATAIDWWYKHRRQAGRGVIGTAAIRRQLRERMMTKHEGPGQYVNDVKSVNMDGTTMHAYGISLPMLQQSGLDTPEKLNVGSVVVKIGG